MRSILVLMSFLLVIMGCSDGGTQKRPVPSLSSQAESTLEEELLAIMHPSSLYTGYNGEDVFQVIALAQLPTAITGSPSWTAESSGVVSMEQLSNENIGLDEELAKHFSRVLITTEAAGRSIINFSYSGYELSAHLTVYDYTAGQVALGATRYFRAGEGPTNRSCSSCHSLDDGPNHSPYIVGAYSNDDIINVLETGFAVHTGESIPINPPHQFSFESAEELEGVIAYLRSLPISEDEF